MNGSAAADDQHCPGIRILRLEMDPVSTLIIVLTEPLGCPVCGRTGQRWVIRTHQDRIVHEPESQS